MAAKQAEGVIKKPVLRLSLPDPERLAHCLEKSRRTDATLHLLEQTVDQLVQRLEITMPEQNESRLRNPYIAKPDHMNTETI